MSVYCPQCQRVVSAAPGADGCSDGAGCTPAESNPFLSLAPSGASPLVSLDPDTQIDRFIVRRLLGRGSFCCVYLAHDTVRSEDVAIKVAPIGPCHGETAALQLRHELTAYDKIKDFAHVLAVHDIFPVPWGGIELLLLSMEYADGGTLREWFIDHRDDLQTRRSLGQQYFKQICLGLRAIHGAGEAHRDTKPENLLFVNGVPKVADLGTSSCASHLTVSAATVAGYNGQDRGTPVYMSPEQFHAAHPDDPDARADIYALGIVYFELLHPKGHPPFGGNYARLRDLHARESVPHLPQASELETRVIRRCLEKDPAKRYQCVDELLDDLEGRTVSPVEDVDRQANAADEADQMWLEARRHVEQRRFNEALRLLRRVTEARHDHIEARALLEELEQRYDQARRLYVALERSRGDQGLDEQMALLAEAVESFPDHPEGRVIHVQLEIKAKQYRQAMEDGLSIAQRGDWDSAQASLERARQLNPGAKEVEGPARFVTQVLQEIQDARQQIDADITAGDFDRAMALARGVDAYRDEMLGAIR